jgi:hypothetical protein
MHQAIQLGLPAPDGHLQGVRGQVGAQVAGQLPADQQPTVGVDDERGVAEARPGPYRGQVGDPELVGPLGGDVAADQVGGPLGLRIAHRGPLRLAAHDALQAKLTQQPLDGAAGHPDALPVELPPELAGAVHLEVLLPDIRTYFRRYQQRRLYLLRPCACNKGAIALTIWPAGSRKLRAAAALPEPTHAGRLPAIDPTDLRTVGLLLLPVLSVDQPTASCVPRVGPKGAVPAHRD